MRMNTIVTATLFAAATIAQAEIVGTTATVRSNNSLVVDIQVTTAGDAAQVVVTYQTPGTEPLASRPVPVSLTGLTTVTVGRLRASRTYNYRVWAINRNGEPAGTLDGTFTTGTLPPALIQNIYTLQGRMTPPVVIMPQVGPPGAFQGFVGLDLQSADAPQIVWYYGNAPSTASGKLQVDSAINIIQELNGNFLISDAGSGGPTAADQFYREIKPDGTILEQSPADCSVTPPASIAPSSWVWGAGSDIHEQLLPGADGVPGTVLHLGKIVKDPFFDAGLAPQGSRLQVGTSIRRWNPTAGTDTLVWDPFRFLDPINERTNATNSDPGINSNSRAMMACAGSALPVEEWTHSNSLQVAPTGEILQSIRHLDMVIAISPMFDRIAWRIGRFSSSFAFLDPSDKFYHQHFARMLPPPPRRVDDHRGETIEALRPNGHLLLFDNGDGRPAAEGGLYSRGLELALDWNTMTARKVWQYRHRLAGGSSTYKYSNSQGEAIRLENGNTLVLFGSDINPATLAARSPQTFTLVEADANPEAGASAVLDMQIPGAPIVYRAIPVNTLFGEATCTPPVLSNASADPAVLWPPNGKFVDVKIRYSVQSVCPVSTTLAVSSNELPPAGGAAEWIVIDPHHVQLKADRLGNGSGRVYNVAITSTNAAGATSKVVQVLVPHDQSH